jgi:hypothetical protein
MEEVISTVPDTTGAETDHATAGYPYAPYITGAEKHEKPEMQ